MNQTPVTPAIILSVAVGSAIGGVARFLVTSAIPPRADGPFPLGTLVVNISGCLVLGALVAFLPGRTSQATQLLLTTGFCGGFTTFSTFSYESIRLMQDGLWSRAASYVGLSVAVGLAAFWCGATVLRAFVGAAPTR